MVYKGAELEAGYRLDFLVEDEVIIVQRLEPIHEAQLLSYLKLSNKWVGLLLNFNTELLKQGIKRLVNEFPDR